MIQRDSREMIQPVRGLAAYRAANAIGGIKRARDERRGAVHKVVDAQMPARLRAFINLGRTQRQRALPGNVTR